MQCSSCLTSKPKFTDPTISDHLLISKTTKNDGRLKPSEIIENEVEDINTRSYGKAIRLPRQRGNRPRVLKTEEKKSYKNTDTASTSIPKMDDKIYTFTLVNPEGKETLLTTTKFAPKEVYRESPYPHPELTPPTEEERAVIFSEPYSPTPPSLLRRIRRKISAMF